MIRRMLTLCVLFAATLTGCATYVNIPAQQGDFASHNPNDWTVRRVTAAALTHLLTNADAGQPVDGPYAIVLPRNSRASTYNWINERLPLGAGRLSDKAGLIPIYRVAQIQVRGLSAQVDIIQPGSAGQEQLVSVYLKNDMRNWYGHDDRLWRIPVGLALRAARPPLPADSPAFRIEPDPAPQPTAAVDDDMAEDLPGQ